MSINLAFLISMVVLLYLALKVKVNAFVALLATALTMGVLSGMAAPKVVNAILTGFAGTTKSIGVVIIFGVILGNYLEVSKCTNTIALKTLRMVGEKRSTLAMAISGFIVSIPVFSDAAFVILMPVVKALAKRTKLSIALLGVALQTGLMATHVYVPPTPGPLAAAGLLGIDLGRAILYGLFASVFMTACGFLYVQYFLYKQPKEFYTYSNPDAEKSYEGKSDELQNTDGPGIVFSLIPLVVPLLLIVMSTTCDMLLPKGADVLTYTKFFGDANIALALGCIMAVIMFGKKMGKEAAMKVVDDSLKGAGPIVFITAAGGALGQVLKDSGAGASMAQMVVQTGIPFILIPFAIAAILKTVQGSGTVAVITAATLSAPIGVQVGLDPILVFLASGAGARAFCHVNDSGFWIFSNYTGADTKTTLKCFSMASIFCAIGGMIATFIVSLWI